MQGISVRPAVMSDYEAICRLSKQADEYHARLRPDIFQTFDGPARPREYLAEWLNNSDASLLVAESDGEVVGYLTIKQTEHPANRPMLRPRRLARIGTMVVDERYQRRGIGSLLLEEARRWAEARHLDAVQLNVFATNLPAIKLYRRRGYNPRAYELELDLNQSAS